MGTKGTGRGFSRTQWAILGGLGCLVAIVGIGLLGLVIGLSNNPGDARAVAQSLATATFIPGSTTAARNELEPTATARATSLSTSMPPTTATRRPEPSLTPRIKPLPETLGTPSFIFTTPENDLDYRGEPQWRTDKWLYAAEEGGKISARLPISQFPDSSSPWSPKSKLATKYQLDKDVPFDMITNISLSAEGPPISVPFSVRLSIQFSQNFKFPYDSAYKKEGNNPFNGIISLFNDTTHFYNPTTRRMGDRWSKICNLSLTADFELSIALQNPDVDGSLFHYADTGYHLKPDTWYEIGIDVDESGEAYVVLNNEVIYQHPIAKMDKTYRVDEGRELLMLYVGAHTLGVKGGEYILNGPTTIRSWAKPLR